MENQTTEFVTFEKRGGVGILTLNRPDKYNSFNRSMALLLQDLIKQCAKDDEVRCLLITANGKAFCAGQDLQEVVAPGGPSLTKILSEHYNPLVLLIRNLEKPVVAAVNGVAAGAGANIALACDIVLAAESASFIQAFSKIGLIPDSGGTYFLPRLVGWQRAMALMMLGDKVSAAEAKSMGMIYDYLPDAEFKESAYQLAHKLASMPTRALALIKRALSYSLDHSLEKQLAMEDQLQSAAGQTADYKEGVEAFLEKRAPKFYGK